MLEIIIWVLGILVVILGYTTINLLLKNEKADDIILSQKDFISQIIESIDYSEKHLNTIDKKGAFKSDDEIGWFFNEVKKIQNILSQFKNIYNG